METLINAMTLSTQRSGACCCQVDHATKNRSHGEADLRPHCQVVGATYPRSIAHADRDDLWI